MFTKAASNMLYQGRRVNTSRAEMEGGIKRCLQPPAKTEPRPPPAKTPGPGEWTDVGFFLPCFHPLTF